MAFVTWLTVGFGIFLLYCAIRNQNPLYVLARRFGLTTPRQSGGGAGGGGGGSW